MPLKGGVGCAAPQRWRQAEAAYDRWSQQDDAGVRLRVALRLDSSAGPLPTPARAEAEVKAVLAELTGPEWKRGRTRRVGSKAFTFLARVHQQLAALPAAPALVRSAVCVEGLRRHPAALRGEEPSARATWGAAGGGAGVVVGR